MPVTRSRTYLTDIGLEDSNNTTGFLFGDEDKTSAEARIASAAKLSGTTDSFPALFRQQAYSGLVSFGAFLYIFSLLVYLAIPHAVSFRCATSPNLL